MAATTSEAILGLSNATGRSEPMTEHDWLACVDPLALRRFAQDRVAPQRFRWLALAWGQRNRHHYEAEDCVWFDAYALWLNGAGPHPNTLELPEAMYAFESGLRIDAYGHMFFHYLRYLDNPMRAAVVSGDSASEDCSRLNLVPIDASKSHLGRSAKKRAAEEARRKAHFESQQLERLAHKERICWEFCNQFRDVAGNPFRPVVADPAWLTPTVVAFAESLYEARAFDRLPILADALEEAGCTSADLLLHCRQPGEHVRGCWAVDLVLGKQ
jgi:hypothetical protein